MGQLQKIVSLIAYKTKKRENAEKKVQAKLEQFLDDMNAQTKKEVYFNRLDLIHEELYMQPKHQKLDDLEDMMKDWLTLSIDLDKAEKELFQD